MQDGLEEQFEVGGPDVSEIRISPAYQAFVEDAIDALIVVGPDGALAMLNSAAEELFGYRRIDLLGRPYTVLLPGVLALAHWDIRTGDLSQPGSGKTGYTRNLGGRRGDGSEFRVDVSCRPLSSGAGIEITALVEGSLLHGQKEAELRGALSLLNATLESTADGILVVTKHGHIAGSNEQFARMWGISRSIMESRDDDRIMAFVLDQLADPGGFLDKVRELYTDIHAESIDVLEFRDGRMFERYSRPQRVADEIVGRVWSFRDVTLRHQAQDQARQALVELAEHAEKLKVMAYTDPLTGLANRALFLGRLEEALGGGDCRRVDVLLLDLDGFKDVNDVHGHQAGDEVLVAVGKRLSKSVRPGATVARLGGDEFIVLLEDVNDPDVVARRIVDKLNTPVFVAGKEMRLSASLGISSSGDGRNEASEMLRQADIALYAAKAAGKNQAVRFHAEMLTALRTRTDFEFDLRHAVERGEIVVHFQPIVSADGGAVLQVEALARWQRGDKMISPLDFIPAAERSGQISTIGLEVLAQSCHQLGAWLNESAHHSVAVNVSYVQLREVEFAGQALDVLHRYGIRPEQLVIEVTESTFSDSGSQATEQLCRLRDLGVRVSIDDFGTGYSSLGRLRELPVDVLKVDKSFVAMIKNEHDDNPILRSVLSIARSLGLQVTAEGVETEAQARKLLRMGCDSLQGYLFGKPGPAASLPAANQRATRAMSVLRRGDQPLAERFPAL
ncbi:EAL domain-containing protein [Arthrobacter sp. AL08]|uniref:putative bifunctional diguanylate cyclase/phosphodiesterase n=1 Tax=unclassified Arthrobacter TaxID=235627 RepID=UPI002499F5CE|nr:MULTISPECIES: bifunctional diguanylate cyclase/phosphodiesterase [unclassified Arthrobacter]MDI3243212.1 EAL domain-containing protein [Arthrobacter sp. AL05]MDI3279222.1 EAL domain-containing protein [Arthrobacter sp. AL08]